ncbi:phage/plasmid primase, P4 family [Streptomyces bohaiensis]|uniref:SF3 helicase domain-containing protein n=1 Tax=Streptomyces bohaiensis TaxID=1431344 RepID=A0ABX1CD04_9ACTN|nr:phage/plasmid primase, P4 family [Streptomyces bohaiensis]NJQ14194.1 hypothetical protein [Streptomyces bohaiensis]
MNIATPIEGAEWLVRHGFAVFPVDHPSLPTCAGIGVGHDPRACDQRGKHCAVPHTKRYARTVDEIPALFGTAPRNVGISVGASSGPAGMQLLVMDSDAEGELERIAAALDEEVPPTMRVITAKGHHDYFWAPAGLKIGNRLGGLRDVFAGDVRSGNAYVIGPGSLHATGAIYTLVDPEQPPVEAPKWLLDQLLNRFAPGDRLSVGTSSSGAAATVTAEDFLAVGASDLSRVDKYTQSAVAKECDAIRVAPDGEQNNTINRAAFSVGTLVGAGAIPESAARAALEAAARDGGHPEGRALQAIASGLDAGIATPRTPWPPVATKQRHVWAVPPPAAGAGTPATFTAGATALDAAPAGAGWEPPQETPALHQVPMPRREWDDMGNAQRVVDRYGTQIRWIADTEQWAVYDAGRWAMKAGATRVWTLVIATVDQMDDEMGQYSDEPPTFPEGYKPSKHEQLTEREQFAKFIREQRMRPKLAAAREVLQAHPEVQCYMDAFDTQEMLLNVGNGVVNLATGELGAHDRELYLMQQSPVCFDPTATAPQFERFLAQVMPDDERRHYLARVVGYTLTASTQEQCLFIHHGTGANGKSVFVRIIMALFGDYGQAVPRSTLLAKKADGIPNDVARMLGKRFLSTSETSAGKRLDDELVKSLTGQEGGVSARFMRGEFFDFEPVGKIHISTNYLPDIGAGHGIERRLQDIGWDVTIPAGQRDPRLADRIIAAELPGVLNWAIRGCLDWQADGLRVPDAVREKTLQHLRDSDPLVLWMQEACDTEVPADSWAYTSELHASYKTWAESAALRPMSVRAFSTAMVERGFAKGQHPTDRKSVLFGIKTTLGVFR